MNTWVRRGAIGVLSLLALATLVVGIALQRGERKLARRIDVPAQPVAFYDDRAALERGAYLFRSRGCADCHGSDGAGRVVVQDANGLFVRAPNITRGARTVAGYGAADWDRAIRHGVKPDGRPLLIMPSEDYNRLTDADLGALVAHVRHLPSAPGAAAELRLPLPVKALYGFGVVRDAAEKIDHTLAPAQPVAEGVTVAHGRYVANSCVGCHGPELLGGKIPGAPPDWPAAARLAPGEGSVMPRYPTADAFAAMLKTGKRPDGSAVSPVMPFASLREMNDVDVRALHLYLSSGAGTQASSRAPGKSGGTLPALTGAAEHGAAAPPPRPEAKPSADALPAAAATAFVLASGKS
ncbi:c-type cytochrome [Piscinibacter koreensis]|uniref:Cytochrome c n=1 Tax=Piscinibacter koreensis TaxID=2742824 RepID=A0A7Y6NLS3_9BURK|nr:cytochrome c [Schlegelella koreensis]NUZ05515.1 cytochrome c [Schlegelella koreensis]